MTGPPAVPAQDAPRAQERRPLYHPARRFVSFAYALRGIWHAARREANFQIQLAIAAACVVAGMALGINLLEWAVVVLACGVLLGAELVNTALEELLDYLTPERSARVGLIKDLAAGFVLTVALAAAAAFALVFGPKLAVLVQAFFGG